MTERTKRKSEARRGGLHPADGILILLLLGAILLGAYAVRQRFDLREHSTVPVVYTLQIFDLSRELWEEGNDTLIPRGALVTNATGSISLGRVVSVEETIPTVSDVSEGQAVRIPRPDRVHLIVRIRAEARIVTGDGIRVSDLRIATFAKGDFRVGGLLAEGAMILSVTEEESK